MKNKEILSLAQALNQVGNLSGIKFSYAVAKNNNLIKTELEAFKEALKPSDAFLEQDKKRIALCENYADKDEKGKAKMQMVRFANGTQGTNYVFNGGLEPSQEYLDAVESLKKEDAEYRTQVELKEKQGKEYDELMEQENKFTPYKIKLADLPKEITAAQTTALFALIEE